MLQYLMPDAYVERVDVINIENLKEKKKIKGLIVDLDNTLVPWGKKYLDQKIIDWVQQVKKYGLKICILSNSHSGHIQEIGEKLEIPFYSSRYKPSIRPFKEAIKIMNIEQEETAVIGDQIFTDVLGGNRLKLVTILVHPLEQKDSLGTRFIYRTMEHFFMKRWLRNGKLKLIQDQWPD